VIIPSSVNECFEFGWKAFDLAEQFQTPIIILSDLDLGMNQWMTKRFVFPDRAMDRGKIFWETDLHDLKTDWGRYLDIDGDGIPYRTVMGNKHPDAPYFSRGTGHDEFGNYSEDPDVWMRNMDRIKLKFETARELLPKPIYRKVENARIGLIAMGSTEFAVVEAQDHLSKLGLPTDFMRVRALPLSKDVGEFIRAHERNYVLELNQDGQLHQILLIEYCDMTERLISLAYIDGLPMTSDWIVKSLSRKEGLNHG
jgi:2-oxoglutarate ferredoxin oxidoreductase subunit alpha